MRPTRFTSFVDNKQGGFGCLGQGRPHRQHPRRPLERPRLSPRREGHYRQEHFVSRSTRVPIFAGPGVSSGQVSTKPAELLDIYPTLVDLCGLPKLYHLEGLSLKPLVDANAWWERPAITSHNQGNYSIVSEEWRHIRYVDGEEELYDIVNDPHEWDNVVGQHSDVAKQMRKWLPKIDNGPVAGSGARVLPTMTKRPFGRASLSARTILYLRMTNRLRGLLLGLS